MCPGCPKFLGRKKIDRSCCLRPQTATSLYMFICTCIYVYTLMHWQFLLVGSSGAPSCMSPIKSKRWCLVLMVIPLPSLAATYRLHLQRFAFLLNLSFFASDKFSIAKHFRTSPPPSHTTNVQDIFRCPGYLHFRGFWPPCLCESKDEHPCKKETYKTTEGVMHFRYLVGLRPQVPKGNEVFDKKEASAHVLQVCCCKWQLLMLLLLLPPPLPFCWEQVLDSMT